MRKMGLRRMTWRALNRLQSGRSPGASGECALWVISGHRWDDANLDAGTDRPSAEQTKEASGTRKPNWECDGIEGVARQTGSGIPEVGNKARGRDEGRWATNPAPAPHPRVEPPDKGHQAEADQVP